MADPKNVMIPTSLFLKLCDYHIFGHDDHADEIRKGLSDKLDAIDRRMTFSEYKAGDEKARQRYLDMVGISEEFRW